MTLLSLSLSFSSFSFCVLFSGLFVWLCFVLFVLLKGNIGRKRRSTGVWPELWGGLESLCEGGEHWESQRSSHNYATEWGRLEADGTGGEGPFYIPLNPRNSANGTLFSLLEMLSLCPLLFLAIVCFLLLGTASILGRPFLGALARRFEIVWRKRSGYCSEEVPQGSSLV